MLVPVNKHISNVNSNGRYFVMKELYTKPVVELEEFETTDVVATSIDILEDGEDD